MSTDPCPDCGAAVRADTGTCECGWAGKKPEIVRGRYTDPRCTRLVDEEGSRCRMDGALYRDGGFLCMWHWWFGDKGVEVTRDDFEFFLERIQNGADPDPRWAGDHDALWAKVNGREQQ